MQYALSNEAESLKSRADRLDILAEAAERFERFHRAAALRDLAALCRLGETALSEEDRALLDRTMFALAEQDDDSDDDGEGHRFSDDELVAAFAGIDYDDIIAAAEQEEDASEDGDEGEEDEEADDLGEAVLTVAQRLKRARAMKVREPRLERMRAIAQKKMASADKLARRARHAAIAILRRKLAGTRGANYDNLPVSEKIAIDKQLQSKLKLVAKIAARLMPMIRKKEMARLQRAKNSDHLPANQRG